MISQRVTHLLQDYTLLKAGLGIFIVDTHSQTHAVYIKAVKKRIAIR
jgi:hypothetical protein